MQSSHQFGGFFPQQQQQQPQPQFGGFSPQQQQQQQQQPQPSTFGQFTLQQQQQQQMQTQVIIKAYIGDQTKRFRSAWPCSFGDMFKNLSKVFQTEVKSTSLQYCDEDGDWISVEKEEEWQELQFLIGAPNKTLKLRVDNGQGMASKQLEQAIEKTLYQIDAFASAVQREGAQAANSKAVRAVYESIRNKLEELIAPEIWAEIFGGRQQQQQQAKPKEQEFTVQVDLKNSSVNLLEQPPKPVVEVPKPVVTPAPTQPTFPRPEIFPPATFPTQPYIPQPTSVRPPLQPPFVFGQQPPAFGQQPPATPFGFQQQPQLQMQPPPQMGFGFQPQPTQQPAQQQPQQQPQPVLNKTPDQSWSFMEVNNQKPSPPIVPPVQQQQQPLTGTPVVTPTGQYATELKQLQDMGLPPANLSQLLDKHKGNIAAVIQEVFAAQ